MAASAALIAFGLARALVKMGAVPAVVGYGAMSVAIVLEGVLLARFIASKRKGASERSAA